MSPKKALSALVLAAMTELLIGCAASHPPPSATEATDSAKPLPIPQDLSEQVRRASDIGRQLYVLDKVAAIGTDVLRANVGRLEDKGLGGYIPTREGDSSALKDSFIVTFFTVETPPRIPYTIRVAPDLKSEFEAFNPPKALDPSFELLIRARQTAINAMPPSRQPINPVLMPGEAIGENGILVYLLAGTTTPNLAVFGKHFRALVGPDGTSLSYLMPLSKTALEIPTRGPNGEKPEALAVTHLVTDVPMETHVFTSLLHKMPVYVGTRRGIWCVDGDKITLVSDKPPGQAR